jgi:hypothetical protein
MAGRLRTAAVSEAPREKAATEFFLKTAGLPPVLMVLRLALGKQRQSVVVQPNRPAPQNPELAGESPRLEFCSSTLFQAAACGVWPSNLGFQLGAQ